MSKKNGYSIKKGLYYVRYVGWKECYGLAGLAVTEPITKDLLRRRRHERDLPKLTLEVTKREIKVTQLTEKKKGKTEKLKYPSVPAKDVTFVAQCTPPDTDVVSCVYLGYNPQTQCTVHIHVYQCDSPDSARQLSDHIRQLTKIPEHMKRHLDIEEELVKKGHIHPSLGEEAMGSGTPTYGSYTPGHGLYRQVPPEYTNLPSRSPEQMRRNPEYDDPARPTSFTESSPKSNRSSKHGEQQIDDPVTAKKFDNLANELNAKLGKSPLLLPPKDYDTVRRKHGDVDAADRRKCLNPVIVGVDIDIGEDQNPEDVQISDNRNSRGSMTSNGRNSLTGSDRNSYKGADGGNDLDDAEIQAISPRWKTPNNYIPPPSNGRPFSPGPMTQDLERSYFGGQHLPGYLDESKQRSGTRNSMEDRLYDTDVYGKSPSADSGSSSGHRNDPMSYSLPEGVLRQMNRKGQRNSDEKELDEPPIDYTIAVRKPPQRNPSILNR